MKRTILGFAIIVGIIITGVWFFQKKAPVATVASRDTVVDKNTTPQEELPFVPRAQQNLNPMQKSFMQAVLAKENKAAEFNNFEKTVYETMENQKKGFMRHAFELLLPSYVERMQSMAGESDTFVNDMVWELMAMNELGKFLHHLDDPQYINEGVRKKAGIVAEFPPEGLLGAGTKYFITDSNNPQQKKWFFTDNPWPKYLNSERESLLKIIKVMINQG